MGRKLTTEEMREKIESKGCLLLTTGNHILTNDNIEIRCPCGNPYITTYGVFMSLNKTKCNICTKQTKIDFMEIEKRISEAGYIFVSMEGEYINNSFKNITVKDADGFYYRCSLGQIDRAIRGKGRLRVFHKSNSYTIKNIPRWLELNNSSFELLSNEYSGAKVRDLEFKCYNCGKTWKAKLRHILVGCGCLHCANSKGEDRTSNWLNDNNIAYIPQKVFPDCTNRKPLHFDFYRIDYNLCIEYDGILHYVDKFNRPEEFKKTKENDKIKTMYCKKNKIPLLVIPYWDFDNIENILTEKLKV